jgi:hypothetical protein
MKHSDFCQLWTKQEDRFAEWRDALNKQCVLLRDAFVARVEPPAEPWVDPVSDENHTYVDLLYLHPKTKRMKGNIPKEALTEKGELMFGLAITFDRDRGSFPKETAYFQIAVRFNAGQAQFSFFKTESDGAETPPGWVSEIPKFVELMLERLRGYLDFDPFAGARDKTGIGFL